MTRIYGRSATGHWSRADGIVVKTFPAGHNSRIVPTAYIALIDPSVVNPECTIINVFFCAQRGDAYEWLSGCDIGRTFDTIEEARAALAVL